MAMENVAVVKSARLQILFENHLDNMTKMKEEQNKMDGIDESLPNIEISEISEIEDFDGNVYTLVECEPVGYMIYHNDSGRFVEYSIVTRSPYDNCEGEYFYAGPNEYYIQPEGTTELKYLFENDYINQEDKETLAELSERIDDVLTENADQLTLNYIKGKNDFSSIQSQRSISEKSVMPDAAASGYKYVKSSAFFRNLNNCGYISGNKCGYIAAGMLLTYDKAINGKNFVTASTHYTGSGTSCSIKTALPTALYNKGVSLGYSNETTSVAIHYTVEGWLTDRGQSVNHVSLYIPFASANTIAGYIDSNRPVIWFGNISYNTHNQGSAGNHAVVVYGYTRPNTALDPTFVAHFGWTNATEVYFSGILGSMYTYTY